MRHFLFAAFILLSDPANADIAANLVGYWKFDETSGVTAADSSGSGNNGTVTGAAWSSGEVGNGLSFSGTGSYVSLSKVLPAFSEFTASAWVKVSSLTANPGLFTTGGYNGTGLRTWIGADGAIYLLMAGGGSYDTLSTAAGTIQSGTFHHVAVTGKSAQYMRIYVDGVLVKEKTSTQTIGAPTSVGYIGSAWNASSGLMNGVIDDVRVYTRALAGNEIYSLSGKTSDTAAPVGSIAINNNAASTNLAKVTLNLSAADSGVGVAGFYLSENTAAPSEGQRGWVVVAATAAYSLNTPFTLSAGSGTKTVYVWYKDLAGNISSAYSDSIADNAPTAGPDWSAWKNIYDAAWEDPVYGSSAAANLDKRIKYAKQMGYDGITFAIGDNISVIKNYTNKNNLKFYFIDPQMHASLYSGNVPTGSSIDTLRSYTQAEKDWYSLNMTWGNATTTWPNNFATGWWYNATSFSPVWDYQQQRVIDLIVENTITIAKSLEDTSKNFTFGGLMYDVARLSGDFGYWNGSLSAEATINRWTGTDSGLLHSGITHEYATFSDGRAAYFKKMTSRMNQEFGTGKVKWIIQPGYIYYDTTQKAGMDEWVYTAEKRPDYGDLQPDLYIVENDALDSFLTEPSIFNSIIPHWCPGKIRVRGIAEVRHFARRGVFSRAGAIDRSG